MWTIFELFRVRRGDAPTSRIEKYTCIGALLWGLVGFCFVGVNLTMMKGQPKDIVSGSFVGFVMGATFGGVVGAIVGAVTRQTFRGTLAWAVSGAMLFVFICWPSFGQAGFRSLFVEIAVSPMLGGIAGAGLYTILANAGRTSEFDDRRDHQHDPPPGPR
jgi:hypothetical protein